MVIFLSVSHKINKSPKNKLIFSDKIYVGKYIVSKKSE